jgi:galactokinase
VRKDGDTQRGKSGPRTFSQRQGFIDIDLKNGETLSLSPGNGAEQYRDQRGNKVHRVSAGSHSQEFKWEGGKHVIVTFLGLRDDYEVSIDALDVLVECLQQHAGVYGCKLTGAGFRGACVALLAAGSAADVKPAVLEQFRRSGFDGALLF